MAKMAYMKLHLFRQDLQNYQDFICFSISILFILPAGAKRFSEDWFILSEK
jgi:hypothetical protein